MTREVRFSQDTIVNVYSTTKTMAALSLLLLADRGEVALDAPAARYWPEFAANGKERVLVVDFDVSRSFNFQGPRDRPNGVHFKPVLHASVADVAASIAGTVTPASDNAMLYAILNAGTPQADTVQTALADPTTGAYVLNFLPPATYTVSVKGTTLEQSTTVTVGPAQDMTGVNFPLP